MSFQYNKGASFSPTGKFLQNDEIKDLIHQNIVTEASEVGSVVPVSILSWDFDEPLRAVILHGSKSSILQFFIPSSVHDRVVKELDSYKHFQNGIHIDKETKLGKCSYVVATDSKHWMALSAHLVNFGFNTDGFMFAIGDKADFNYLPSDELMASLNSGAV